MMNKNYISELDCFLENFLKTNPERSESQKKAINKFKKIIEKRDNITQSIDPLDFSEQ